MNEIFAVILKFLVHSIELLKIQDNSKCSVKNVTWELWKYFVKRKILQDFEFLSEMKMNMDECKKKNKLQKDNYNIIMVI